MKKTIHKKKINSELDKEVQEIKREWKHLKKFTDENYLLFTAFVVIMAAILVVNTVYVLNRNNAGQPTVQAVATVSNPISVLTSLQTAQTDVLTVKVSNVTENNKLDYAYATEPGNTMLICTLTITNNTAATQHLIPVNQFYVRSNEGDYAPLHASTYVTSPLAATDLAPGKTVSGQLSFSVPKHIASPLLYVDTNWNGSIPTVFDVLH